MAMHFLHITGSDKQKLGAISKVLTARAREDFRVNCQYGACFGSSSPHFSGHPSPSTFNFHL